MSPTKSNFFRKRKIVPSESQEQRAVITWWASYCKTKKFDERLLFAIPNGAHLAGDARQRAIKMHRMKAEGLRVGVPDLFLAVPREIPAELPWHACGLFIEMKALNGKLSNEQSIYRLVLNENGYLCTECHGATEAIKLIKYYIEEGR